jgi:hypothetical protein
VQDGVTQWEIHTHKCTAKWGASVGGHREGRTLGGYLTGPRPLRARTPRAVARPRSCSRGRGKSRT